MKKNLVVWFAAVIALICFFDDSLRAATCAELVGGDKPRPWAFLDATYLIEVVPETCNLEVFRGALEGDLDLDGDKDVVVAQACTAAGVVGNSLPGRLYMNENGKFVERTSELIPELLTKEVRWWANVHDFTGDGWPDIFVPGGNGQPSKVFRNLGVDPNGVFLGFVYDPSRISGPLASSTQSYHSHKADLDDDGQMDIVVFQYRPDLSSAAGQTRVLMQKNGFLVDETAARLPTRSEPTLYGEIEDVDDDQDMDIVLNNLLNGLVPLGGCPSGIPTLRVLINDGAGNFPTNLALNMPERTNKCSGFGVYALAVHDVNGDHVRPEIYAINWGKGSSEQHKDGILMNLGTGLDLYNQVTYPVFSTNVDNDGDHPVLADLDGDQMNDVVTAQFATPPYLLRNNEGTLEQNIPPQAPKTNGFRVKVFDANGDKVPDIWFALDPKNFLNIGAVQEVEPNRSFNRSNCIVSLPSLVMGGLANSSDRDVYRLPPRAQLEGATIRLEPPANSDPQLRILDELGRLVATSANPGAGVEEEITISGLSAFYVEVKIQGQLGSGLYRLNLVDAGVPFSKPTEQPEAPVRPRTDQ